MLSFVTRILNAVINSSFGQNELIQYPPPPPKLLWREDVELVLRELSKILWAMLEKHSFLETRIEYFKKTIFWCHLDLYRVSH